jgi:glycerol uptake facilitator-like aquaporin
LPRPSRGKTIPAIAIGICMDILIRALVTFVIVLLVLYLVNMLPVDGRAKQIVRVIVIIIGVLSFLQLSGEFLNLASQPCAVSKAM